MRRLRIVQQLKDTMGFVATLALLWRVPAATMNNVAPMRLTVNSTLDAQRLAWAASRVGTIVDAVVVGSVIIDEPIQIGNFGRLAITGHGSGAQLTFARRPTSSVDVDFQPAKRADGGIISGFFNVRSNASLVLDNLSILEQDTIGASLPALIRLHPGSLVEAEGCTLHADTVITGSSSGSDNGRNRGSTDVSTIVSITHAPGSRVSLSDCHISPVRGQPSGKQAKDADERRVGTPVVERSLGSVSATSKWDGDEDSQRRLNDYNCPHGYDGASCTDCASGFSMDSDGACQRTEVHCTAWAEFGGGVLAVLGVTVLLLTLDSVRNGKSPPHRIVQIWKKIIDYCRSGKRFCQDVGIPSITSEQPSMSRIASPEMGNKNENLWGRESLGRFLHGCMAFVVTSQIVSQGIHVLKLELPSAMKNVVAWLEWTNMDPLLVPVTCSLTRASFLDRAVGTVGLLTAFLTVLALSQITIALRGSAPKGNEEPVETRSNTISHSLRWAADDTARVEGNVRASHVVKSILSGSSRQPGEASSARAGLESSQEKGAWERWDQWDSSERHALAAVMACLLIHPVVCTILLRVFDCRNVAEDDGLWLRADLSIECLSVHHQAYRVVAAIFLGLYGIGIPVTFLAIVLWAKNIDKDDTDSSLVGTEKNTVRTLGSISTTDTNSVALRNLPSREMSTVEAETFAATTSSAIVSAEEGGEGGVTSGTRMTKDVNRQRILQSPSHTFNQRCNNDVGMDDSEQNGAGCNKVGKNVASQENADDVLATNCLSKMDGEKGGEENRRSRELCRRKSRWSDVCVVRRKSDRARSRVTDRASPKLMGNTSIETLDKGTSYLGRAWRISGRCIMSVGRFASSAGRSGPSEGNYQLGNHWRCTIPLWSPYCTDRRWFAAWDLARRTLLTGVLTLIPADEGGTERVAVACAMAGLSLVVAEVARPYRDPWIGGIYRMGGVVILLVDILGLLQEVWAAGSRSPSVVTIEALFLLFLPLMIFCICCGWRLSCLEQRAGAGAAIIPWPESASFRRPPSDAGAAPIRHDNSADGSNYESSSSLPPDICVSWYKEESILGDDTGVDCLQSAKERGSGTPGMTQSVPSCRNMLACGSDHSSNSKPEPEPENAPTFVQKVTYSNPAGAGLQADDIVNEGSSETTHSDSSSCRSITPSKAFDRSMLSRSPRTMAGAGILRFGLGFRNESRYNSSESRVPIETHQTAYSRAFHSNSIEMTAQKMSWADLSNYGARGKSTPSMTRSQSCSDSSDLDNNAVGAHVAQRLHVSRAESVEGRTTLPMIAPGAPSIDGHMSRFLGKARPNRSSSSFSSTSFESSTTGERSRKGSASRRRDAWRRSASSSGFFNRSRSQSGSQSGDLNRSPVIISPPGSGGSKVSQQGSSTSAHFSRGNSSLLKIMSTASGSFMSSGSGSISSLTNSAGEPPVLRALQTKSPAIVENEHWTTISPGSEKVPGQEAKRGWSLAKRGWPLDLPIVSEMPARWIKNTSNGDSHNAQEGDLARGPTADNISATTDNVSATAEQDTSAAHVKTVFDDENHTTPHKVSNSEGRRNIIKYRAFLWTGGSGPSSCDSRASEGNRNIGCSDVEESGNTGPKNHSSARLRMGDRWLMRDNPTRRAKSSLSRSELKQDVDFEDEGELEENPVNFMRDEVRINTITGNAKMDEGR